MNVKSLLCAAAMLSVCSVAQAFPSYSLYPDPEGDELDNAQYLTNLVLTVDAPKIEVSGVAFATLTNAGGEEIESTDFFRGSMHANEAIIWFEEDEITVNGTWTLTIPAGSISVDGEENPEFTVVYTLNDPNLGLGDFPQIELLSADPADGDKLPVWGGSKFDKVTLKTTDDDAVNYIEWFLYDVTNGEEPGVAEYLLQGNDNRYDFNRYKHHDDIWTDGLYIAVASNEKLIEGHKYRLDLRFCGIGYNDKKNQYPTPQQLDASTELETSIYYYGLTPGPEYSPYVYESVIPDPASGYVISSLEWAHFLVTYSGPVQPEAFNYAFAAGTAAAGEWVPADGIEVDDEGFATAWEFTFFEKVVEDATGTISVSIQTKDKDGLYVKGNVGMTYDDNLYYMDWECNLGAPALISVDPTDGSEVESLSSITVTNERGLIMAKYYGVTGYAQISDRSRAVVRELGDPVISEDGKQATWTFEPLTDADIYSLYVSDKYFVIGEEFDSYYTNATTFTYTISGSNISGEAVYDLLPSSVIPADKSELTSLSDLVLSFDDVTYCPFYEPAIQLYKDGVETPLQEMVYDDSDEEVEGNDLFAPTSYTIHFSEVTEAGSYRVVIPQGYFYDGEFDETGGESGHASPEIILNYTIGNGNVVKDLEPVTITPANKSNVNELGNIELTFAEETYPVEVITGASFVRVPAELYFISGNEEKRLQAVDPLDNIEAEGYSYIEPKDYVFKFGTYTADGDLEAYVEKGQYKVVIKEATFCTEEYMETNFTSGRVNPEITLYYTVGDNSGVDAIVGGDKTINVYDVNGVQILKNADVETAKELKGGIYIINGKKVIVRR